MAQVVTVRNRQLASRPVVPVQDPYWVGVSLSSKSLVRYCEADSLLDGKKILIPAAFVYLGYGSRDEPVYAIGDSNGCAAGESKSDATFRALLELIERDAFAIWWFNRIERTGLSFAHDELLCRIASSVEAEARSLRLYDLTSDLGVPVVAASIADEKGSSIYVGSAAGISEVSAARKAAIEALSFWFWGRMASEPVSRRKWLKEATLDNQPWLLPEHHRHLVSDEVIQFGDVRALTSGLIRAGCEPVVVNLTKDYFQISVVRVIAPGLRSHMPRFAPGRLFDVPVKQGWLSSAQRKRSYCLILVRFESESRFPQKWASVLDETLTCEGSYWKLWREWFRPAAE